jgi:hypothetical protein
MRWFLRGSVLALYLGALLTVGGAGCAENNEKSAGITGKPPPAPVSYTAQGKGGKGETTGYPGTAKPGAKK